MKRSENGGGDCGFRIIAGAEPGSAKTLRQIEAATDHLARLQEILLEMLCDKAAPAFRPGPQPSPEMPAASLSRPALDQLARDLGEPPLRDHPDLPRRGLQIVGGWDLPAGPARPATPPLRSRIDQHLRLCLDATSNRVAVEQRGAMRWQRLGLDARKDGHGGITLDRAALERLAGPLSPGLARFLRAGPAPASVPAPAQTPDHPAAPPPPCREEG